MDYMQRIDLQGKDHWNNMLIWCNEMFGEVKIRWAAINYGDASATFLFRDEQDYTQFVQAWIG